jgi:glucose/arabinose dehydrogenase
MHENSALVNAGRSSPLQRRRSRRDFKRRSSAMSPPLELLEDRAMLTTTLLPGFAETTVTTGIAGPTAMEFSPDGRLWVLEQGGNVKLVHSDGTTFTALHQTVDSTGERGMLGIAFDPHFAANHFVYLYYTNPNPGGASWATGEHNQLSRFTVNDSNLMQPVFTSEAPILDWNNLSGAINHNGGAIHFGKDGMLYADAGDNMQTFTGPDGIDYRVSQSLDTLLGKQLRIDVSKFNASVAARDDVTVGHLIPNDNPFVGTVSGINQLIYALGLRNPFTFAVQPGTGRILINDVGENTWEEIDDSIAGANYGWSGGNTDGFGHSPPSFAPGTYHDPLLAYTHSGSGSLATGAAIVGGTFYNPPTAQFPAMYVGMYFYEDLSSGWIRYFNPNTPNDSSSPDGDSVEFASNTPGGLRDLTVDSAGNLYYLSGGDGSIRKISFTGAGTSQVEARNLFYHNSTRYDTTGNPQTPLPFSDDNAIATDKNAYVANGTAATFANVSSYPNGINGVMVDLLGGGSHTSITLANILKDFTFKAGNNNSPGTWAAAPSPTSVTVRPAAGVSGSDRVELVWADGAIKEEWLEVIVKPTANTGLAANDVFFFGNAVANSGGGDTATLSETNSVDELGARNNGKTLLNNIPITNPFDYNRDGLVDSVDSLLSRNNSQTLGATRYINISAGGPFSPLPPGGDSVATSAVSSDPAPTGGGDSGVASALVSSTSPSESLPPVPIWIVNRLSRLDLNHGPIANYFEHLAHEGTPKAKAILVKAGQVADALSLDVELLDELLVGLNL